MTDIVERLRKENSCPPYYGVPKIQADAADEIASLRFQLDGVLKMRNEADAKVRHLMQTHDDMADEMERLRSGMIQMAEAMATQVATIERLRAALEDCNIHNEWPDRIEKIARAALEGKQ